MKIDRDVVETMADLAKLWLDAPDIAEYTDAMSRILELVEQMQAVDTNGVEPLAHPLDAVQRLRDDKVTESDRRERFQALAPEVTEGLYLVPKVIE